MSAPSRPSLLIVYDERDVETAARLARLLAQHGLPCDLRPLAASPETSSPAPIPAAEIALLLVTRTRSDWEGMVVEDEATMLLTVHVGVSLGDPGMRSPAGTRNAFVMPDVETGGHRVAFAVRRLLGLPDDAIASGAPEEVSDASTALAESFEELPAPELAAAPPAPAVGTQIGAANDRVAKTDSLGFHHYVQAFADLIESPHTKPPLTIGVYGSWGMGKSFLLEHVIERLRVNQSKRSGNGRPRPDTVRSGPGGDKPPTPSVYTVSFNAWEYSAAEVIWPGLVRKIMDTLEREISGGRRRLKRAKLNRNFARRFKAEVPKVVIAATTLALIASSVLWTAAFDLKQAAVAFGSVGAIGLLKVLRDTLEAPLGQWVTTLFQEMDYGKQIGHMAEIRDDLELLETLLREENGRMVVVIDDLDRCEPEKAVEMLQAINLLLNFESFIVVMGIDARIVTRAIESHYRDLLGAAGASGYEYLDKIVQIPFRIPESEPSAIMDFLRAQLDAADPGPTRADAHRDGVQAPANQEDAALETTGPHDSEPLREAVGPANRYEAARDLIRGGEKESSLNPAPAPVVPALPPITFSSAEVAAFEAAAEFLKPNPRHIKRLVNVYRLVRSLAHLRSERTLLDNPAATLRWLITSGQWPFAAHAMLTHFADMDERGETLPEGDPLPVLLERIRPILGSENAARLDHDHDVLDALLRSGYGAATSEELRIIRRYTVNFNPAVERELLLSVQNQTHEARPSGANENR